MATPRLKIPCETCVGTGEIDMPGYLLRTLQSVLAGVRTSIEIHKRDPGRDFISVNAISNRLKKLMELGYVTRSNGPNKYFIYAVTAKASTKGTHVRSTTTRRKVQTRRR